VTHWYHPVRGLLVDLATLCTVVLQYAREEMSKFQAAQQVQQQPTLQQIASMNQPSSSTAAIPGPSFQSPPPEFADPQVGCAVMGGEGLRSSIQFPNSTVMVAVQFQTVCM